MVFYFAAHLQLPPVIRAQIGHSKDIWMCACTGCCFARVYEVMLVCVCFPHKHCKENILPQGRVYGPRAPVDNQDQLFNGWTDSNTRSCFQEVQGETDVPLRLGGGPLLIRTLTPRGKRSAHTQQTARKRSLSVSPLDVSARRQRKCIKAALSTPVEYWEAAQNTWTWEGIDQTSGGGPVASANRLACFPLHSVCV